MRNQLDLLRNSSRIVGLLAVSLSMVEIVCAQTSLRYAGEITSAGQATINGTSAISGMTVFSNNRIRTTKQGAVVINLGGLGRIEFGAETDMTLRFSQGSIGGELHTGRLVVSTRAGVAISVHTSEGQVTSDGQQPAVITIAANGKQARILAHQGKASFISNSNVEHIETGEELTLTREGWRRNRLPSTNSGRVSGNNSKAVTATTSISTLSITGLVIAAINYSIDRVFYRSRENEQLFDTTVTCRDQNNIICRRWGGVTPK